MSRTLATYHCPNLWPSVLLAHSRAKLSLTHYLCGTGTDSFTRFSDSLAHLQYLLLPSSLTIYRYSLAHLPFTPWLTYILLPDSLTFYALTHLSFTPWLNYLLLPGSFTFHCVVIWLVSSLTPKTPWVTHSPRDSSWRDQHSLRCSWTWWRSRQTARVRRTHSSDEEEQNWTVINHSIKATLQSINRLSAAVFTVPGGNAAAVVRYPRRKSCFLKKEK